MFSNKVWYEALNPKTHNTLLLKMDKITKKPKSTMYKWVNRVSTCLLKQTPAKLNQRVLFFLMCTEIIF